MKHLGAHPGDCVDGNTFTLPTHESENLTIEQSTEKIAEYFAKISQEFPPLDINCLPDRVKAKLLSTEKPPLISDYETYCKIISAKQKQNWGAQ